MRTAFVSTGYYPQNSGGGSISTNLIVEELRNHGFEVDVFTTTGTDNTIHRVAEDHYQLPDGTAYGMPARVGKNYGIFSSMSILNRYDLIHVYGLGSLPGVTSRASVPVIGTANNLEWTCINWSGYLRAGCPEYSVSDAVRLARQDGYGATLPLKLGMEALGKRLSKQADQLTVQTDGMNDILQKCGYSGQKITTVPNILDDRFDIESDEPDNHLIYVGRLVEKKGIVEIVEAYLRLPSEIRDEWKFSIFGDGACKQQIERKIAQSDADIELRYCPYEELHNVYRKASVLIHGSKYPEPFSRTWLEAMASETALICSTNPSSRAVLDDIAEFYDPFDPSSLDSALAKVLSAPDRRSEMADKGKQAVQQYRPKEVVSQYASLYHKCVNHDTEQ